MNRRVRDHPVVTLSAAKSVMKSDGEYTNQSICLLNNQDCLVVIFSKPDGSISSGCTSAHDEDVDLFCLRICAGSGQGGTQKDTITQSHGEFGGKSLSEGGIIRSSKHPAARSTAIYVCTRCQSHSRYQGLWYSAAAARMTIKSCLMTPIKLVSCGYPTTLRPFIP